MKKEKKKERFWLYWFGENYLDSQINFKGAYTKIYLCMLVFDCLKADNNIFMSAYYVLGTDQSILYYNRPFCR